jgi:Fe-S cluster biogenesis protein NfuA
MNNGEFQAHTEQLERLLEQINGMPDENARTSALELMQCLMDLHGAAVSRIVEVLSNAGEGGRNALARIAEDPLICGLLVLYGVHPLSAAERVCAAVEKVRPQLQRQGASFEVVSCVEGVVRVTVQSPGRGQDAPTTFRSLLEPAIREAAPEVNEVILDGIVPPGFVPVKMIQPMAKEEKEYEKSAA